MRSMDRIRIMFISLLALFLAVDVALVAYLFWPGTSQHDRRTQENELQQQLKLARAQVAPLAGIDKKLVDTRGSIKKFYEQHVPGYESEISTELHKLVQQSGVTQQNVHYASENVGIPSLDRVKLEFAVTGDYPKIAHFINALERDKWLFVINQVSLSGQSSGQSSGQNLGQNPGIVQLQIRCETFLKGAA